MLADPQQMRLSGWLIERHFNSELRYWAGRGVGNESFSPDISEAIRFARVDDAEYVLCRSLDGIGRVAEHVWTGGLVEVVPVEQKGT